MKVLFTGHRGFLGKELIPLLIRFHEIVTTNDDLRDSAKLQRFVEMNGVEFVIHAATKGGRRFHRPDCAIYENNVTIFRSLVKLNLPIISFCSGAIYNKELEISGPNEEEIPSIPPRDPYGKSKWEIRNIAKEIEDVFLLRFFNAFGPLEDDLRFIKHNIKNSILGRPLVVFQDFVMDFFFVHDSVPVIQEILAGNRVPKEMNLVYEAKQSLLQLCDEINRLTNSTSPINLESKIKGKNYYGNGDLYKSMNFPRMGLNKGLLACINSQKFDL